MRLRRRKFDDFRTWPETIEAARVIIAAYRRMGEDPPPILLRMVGETNE